MRFISLVIFALLFITATKVHSADAYQSALKKTVDRYKSSRGIPKASLRWLSKRFGKSPDAVSRDLKAVQGKSPTKRISRSHTKQVSVNLSGPRMTFLQKTCSYTIEVHNTGLTQITDATLHLRLPKQKAFRMIVNPGLRWKLGTLAPGAKRKIVTAMEPIRVGSSKLTAVVSYLVPQEVGRLTVKASHTTRAIGIPAMHFTCYDTEDPLAVGLHTTYVIEARNEGTSPCTNVQLVNRIPAEMKLVKVKAPSKGKLVDGKLVFQPIPILQPGDKIIYKIQCKAIRTGSAKNSATIKYDQFRGSITTEEGTSVFQ